MGKRIIVACVLLLIIIVPMAGGCGPEPVPQPGIAPDPFTVVWGPGKDYVVTFSGNSAGHTAGGTSEFTLKLDNNSLESWQGEYTVQLLGSNVIVVEVARDTFTVPVGLEAEIIIPVEFGSELDGPYGLSLYIPERKAQSVHTIWIGEKDTVEVGPWPSLASHPWLWPESEPLTEDAARQKALKFVKNSPTFVFDGIEESLELAETLYPDMENAWQFVYRFESRHAGYGDRTGEMLAQVITPHEAIVTVEQGEIRNAVMDGEWDMLEQRMLNAMEITPAPIHEVEVRFMESFPIQVGVFIKGGLRDGCTTFHDAAVSREGNTITIEVTVQKPKEMVCPAVYTYFEENLNLGSDFTPGTTYTLNVNDYTTTFEMP